MRTKIMIIAFIGNDGSGKTTIAKETINFFNELGFETLYKHEYEYTFITFLFKLMGKGELQKSRKEMLIERKRSLKYDIWPLFVWVDTFFVYLYFKIFKRRTAVILDRYAYDQYLSFRYLGNLKGFIEWLYLHFPRPDIGIVLAVRPEIAYERKRETHNYPLIFYKQQSEEYLSLATRLGLPVITTDEEFRQTIKKAITIFICSRRISKQVLQKAVQNRIVFYLFKKYDIIKTNHLSQTFWESHEKRIRMVTKTIEVLKEILKNSGVEKYALVKTHDDFEFMGNDIDVIISPLDFDKIQLEISRHYDRYKIEKINYKRTKDKGKMDVFIENGFKIDVHTYIGWRNVVFFHFKELEVFVQIKRVFGSECNALDYRVNSIIVATTHIYEKGFLTLDEYLYLQKHFDDGFLENMFPKFLLLEDYIKWLKQLLKVRPERFPVFISHRIILKSYLKLLTTPGNKVWKVRAFLRDLALFSIWKIRYHVNGRLPFEVEGIPTTSFIERSHNSNNSKLQSVT